MRKFWDLEKGEIIQDDAKQNGEAQAVRLTRTCSTQSNSKSIFVVVVVVVVVVIVVVAIINISAIPTQKSPGF